MKLHLKLTSVLLSAVMCASMVMAPVSVIADETSAPEETQTTEATEKEETKETEKKTPKTTEKPAPKESKATEPEEKKPSESKESEPEETEPSETVKETDPTETEDKKPAETEETEASKPEETKPSDAKKEEPAETSETEPTQTTKPDEEDAPETTVTPEAGGKEDTHSVPPKNAGTTLSSVSITLDVPVVGAKPDYTAVFPSGANYYSDAYNEDDYRNDIVWYDIASEKYVNPDSGVFKAGHQYRVHIYLTAKDGYIFTNSTTATLNGQTAETSLYSGQLSVDYTFPKLEGEPDYISSVSITLDAPAVGAKPDYTAVFPSGADYYSYAYNEGNCRNDIGWYDITSDNWVNPDSGAFEIGHQYRVRIYLTAKDGDFTNSTTATLNGQTAETSLYSGQLRVDYTFPKLADYISSVSITLDAPAVGAKPDYTAVFPSGANYYSYAYNESNYRNDIVWYDITSDYNVNPDSGVFKNGHQYRVSIYLTAKDGYIFTNSTTATLNGQTAETSLYSGQLRVVYTFPVLAGLERIDSVSVTLGLIDPSLCLGSHFSYDTYLPSDANYYSKVNNEGYYRNDVAWYDETTESYGNPDTGTFEGGHKYTVIVYLTPKVGYSFTNNTTATLNDKFTAEATLDGERLKVTYTFSPVNGESVDVINYVSCTIDAPAIGSNLDFNAEFPTGSKYGKITNSVIWHDITTNADLNSSSLVFECGHQYQVRIDIYSDDGYYFTDTTGAALNEQSAEVEKLAKNRIRISYTFTELGEKITTVSVSLDAPTIGAKPDYEAIFPSGANYSGSTGYISWKDITTNETVDPDSGLFLADHQYQVCVKLIPKEGYYFDSTTATLNGQTVSTSMDGSQLKITYTFGLLKTPSVGDIETVDNVNYKITNANTDGTGTVTLIGMAVKRASVSIPATVEINGFTYIVNRIGTKAFYGDKTIKTVYIGNNIAIIDASAFYGCSHLTKVSGGKGLKTIGSSAFARCSKLKTFVITSSVLSKIGTYTFNKDSKLKTIYIKYTTKLTKSGVKKSLKGSKVKTVKVKKSKVKKYKKYFKKKNSGRSVKVKK